MIELLSIIILISFLVFIYFIIRWFYALMKHDKNSKSKNRNGALISLAVTIIAFFSFGLASDNNKSSSKTSQTSSESAKKESEKKYSESVDKKSDSEASSAKKKNESSNASDFSKVISSLPGKSNGTINSADYDKESSVVTITLADKATNSMSNDEMRTSCFNIWRKINSLGNNYNQTLTNVIINDTTGDTIARTSYLGDKFKYIGMGNN